MIRSWLGVGFGVALLALVAPEAALGQITQVRPAPRPTAFLPIGGIGAATFYSTAQGPATANPQTTMNGRAMPVYNITNVYNTYNIVGGTGGAWDSGYYGPYYYAPYYGPWTGLSGGYGGFGYPGWGGYYGYYDNYSSGMYIPTVIPLVGLNPYYNGVPNGPLPVSPVWDVGGFAATIPSLTEPIITPTSPRMLVLQTPATATKTEPTEPVAHLTLMVPENAEVWLEGKKMDKPTGTVRSFVSPQLKPNQEYVYDLQVRWTENGKSNVDSHKIPVRAGDNKSLTILSNQR